MRGALWRGSWLCLAWRGCTRLIRSRPRAQLSLDVATQVVPIDPALPSAQACAEEYEKRIAAEQGRPDVRCAAARAQALGG